MKIAILAAAALSAFVATPAAADWAAGRVAAAGGAHWYPDTSFPTTPPIQRYGKGRKGLKRYGRALIREAEFRRYQEDLRAVVPAAAQMEDARGSCDRRLKAALESGDQAEIEETRDRCKPRPYGPYLR